ncbi:MAG: CRTAC1 family protein [Bryobacteraceae bacterium]
MRKVCLGAVPAAGLLLLAAGQRAAQFTDAAAEAGLTDTFYCGSDTRKTYILETLGGGVALVDYDGDGYLDVFVVTGSRFEGFPGMAVPTHQLYRNRRNGTFERVTREAGLADSGWGQGVCAGDYDNDGFTDLFVTYYGQNRLYRNTGKGRFAEVSGEAGLRQETRWSTGCAFLDYDRDGRLDLFVANYIVFDKDKIPPPGASPKCQWKGIPTLCGPTGLPGGTNQLFHNEGGGRFRNVSEASGIAAMRDRYSLSVTPFDYDRDGWPDIYVAVDSQASLLFRNNHDGTFREVAVEAGVAYRDDGREQAGMGSAAGDLDGDGWLDLVKTNFIDDTANFYRNNGDGTFDDIVHAAGAGRNTQYMGWGVVFADYDNDGLPDVFMVNGHVYPEIEGKMPGQSYRQRSLLYRNLGGRKLEDVSERAGMGVLARHSARGVAAGDYDNDGDVDLFANNMNEPPSLLRNSGSGGNYLSLALTGVKSNRSAIGARVTVTAGGRKQTQEVRSGSTFLSQSDLRLHFGLGTAELVERIDIEWPRADSREVIKGVRANRFLKVVEGKGVAEP